MIKESHIQTSLNLDFDAVEKIVLGLLKKQNFEFKGQEIKVNAVEISGLKDKLVIETDLSGAFDGKMNLIGKPVYNKESQIIQLAQVDIDLRGRNFLSKAIVFVLGNYIEQKIIPLLKFSIKNQIEPANEILQFLPIKFGLFAKAKINELDIYQIDVLEKTLILHFSLKGNIQLNLESDPT